VQHAFNPPAFWHGPRPHSRPAAPPGSACLPVMLKACLWHDGRRFLDIAIYWYHWIYHDDNTRDNQAPQSTYPGRRCPHRCSVKVV